MVYAFAWLSRSMYFYAFESIANSQKTKPPHERTKARAQPRFQALVQGKQMREEKNYLLAKKRELFSGSRTADVLGFLYVAVDAR